MRLLIVGGAGYVGRIIRPAIEQEHECTHFDLQPVPETRGHMIIGDVNDEQAVAAAIEGPDGRSPHDLILYMAMGTVSRAERATGVHTTASFAVNVCGCYRFLRRGLAAGVRRFVYVSSLSVYQRFRDRTITEQVPADAWHSYGLSKRAGELICQAAAQAEPEARILALRLMFPRNEADWPEDRYDPAKERNRFAVGPQDTRRLFLAALGFDRPGFYVVQATGDVTNRNFPNDEANRLLGWLPRNE